MLFLRFAAMEFAPVAKRKALQRRTGTVKVLQASDRLSDEFAFVKDRLRDSPRDIALLNTPQVARPGLVIHLMVQGH